MLAACFLGHCSKISWSVEAGIEPPSPVWNNGHTTRVLSTLIVKSVTCASFKAGGWPGVKAPGRDRRTVVAPLQAAQQPPQILYRTRGVRIQQKAMPGGSCAGRH